MKLLDRAMGMLKGDKSPSSGGDGSTRPPDFLDKLDQAKGSADLFKFIKEKVEESRSSASRIAHESIWMQNCAYTIGFAGLYFDARTRSFAPVDRSRASPSKNRMHVNKILPNLQNRLAKLTKNPPRFDVRPNGNSQEDKDNARLKLDTLIAKWDEMKLNLRRQEMLMWVQECGHAYFWFNWDDSLGNYIRDEATGEGFFEGDIRADVCAPFEVFPDPLAKSFDEAQYFIRAKVRPLHYFRDQYDNGAEVKEEETWLMSLQFESRINSMNNKGFSSSTAQLAQKHTAIELCYVEKPCKKYPQGRMIIGANGVILKEGPLPIGKLPLAKFDDIVVAGKFYPEAVVTHVKPVQDQYNNITKREADWINKLMAGKYSVAKGAELMRESMDDQSGELLEYTPVPNAPNGGAPTPIDIPMIPSFVFSARENLDKDFSEIMGLSEVSKGQLPSASIPAQGMEILQEADDTRIGVEVLNHEFGYGRCGEIILDFVQRMYKTPRKMKFAGKEGLVIKEVSGDDLKGTNDVVVVPGSTIPGSKVLRRQDILNAFSQGLLGDPTDPVVRENVLGMLELGDTGEVFLDHSLDQHRIKSEIESIENEQMPYIDEGYNHPVHIKELNRYVKSDKYDLLSDLSKEIFQAVREEHLRFTAILSGAMPAAPDEEEEAMSVDAEANAIAQSNMPLENEVVPQEQAAPGPGGM
jgi:hypothetical protein